MEMMPLSIAADTRAQIAHRHHTSVCDSLIFKLYKGDVKT